MHTDEFGNTAENSDENAFGDENLSESCSSIL